MELLAYHKWLLQISKGDRDLLMVAIARDYFKQNEMAFDLIELTGEKTYDHNTFYKAADLILNNKLIKTNLRNANKLSR